ncbi:hypothetical protein [Agaribacter marinus]|uniref:PEP-CTERM system TPR-repeat lipoprotein n=1 Tax=Agaribacter marinus TaxID=1431249 RepID=A0AA37WI68_9ALTE|nr:hypothetical protein [Agaribacter marinus]GLR71881.1 hypothetical protein GCM10007852_27890 [Agaribacter marinus]
MPWQNIFSLSLPQISIIRLISIVLAIVYIAGCAKEHTEESLTSEVETLLEEKKYSQAELIIKSFLVNNTESALSRALLMEALVEQGDYNNGVLQWDKIGNTSIDRQASYDRLLEAYYFLAQDQLAISFYETIHDANTFSKSDFLIALISMRQNDISSAKKIIEDKISADNGTSIAQFLVHSVELAQGGDKEKFSAFIKSIDKSNALYDWPVFQSVAANFFYNDLVFDDAEVYFDSYLQHRKKHFEVYLTFIDSLIRQNSIGKAEQYIDYVLQISASQPIANQQKAHVLLTQNRVQEAKPFIERAISNGYGTRDNYLAAGLINFNLKNYEQTIGHLERALQDLSGYSEYQRILDYAKARASGAEATSIVDNLPEIEDYSDLNRILAVLKGFEDSGNDLGANQIVNHIAKTKTSNVRLGLETYLRDGISNESELGNVILLAKDAINKNEGRQGLTLDKAKIIYISHLLTEKKLTEATAMAKDWVEKYNFAMVDVLLYVDTLIANQQHEDALYTLLEAKKVRDLAVYHSREASVYVQLEQNEKAISSVKNALSLSPYSSEYLRQYLLLSVSFDEQDDEFITNLLSDYKSNQISAIQLSLYYTLVGNLERSISVLKEVNFEESNQEPFESYSVVLAQRYQVAGDIENMKAVLERFQKTPLTDIRLADDIGYLLSKTDSKNEAIRFYSLLADTYPANTTFTLALANLHIENKDNNSALKVLSSMEDKNSSRYLQLSGIANRNKGELGAARTLFSRAFKNHKDETSMLLLAEHLYLIGEIGNANKLISDYLLVNPESTQARFLLASKSTPEGAINIYEEVLGKEPNNVFALTNLAWLEHESGNTPKAKPIIEKAIALAPENEGVKNTYNSIFSK